MSKKLVSMTINGKKVEEAVEPRLLLIHFLR
jgi:carbon-monoxide dehydrogenase small subunit